MRTALLQLRRAGEMGAAAFASGIKRQPSLDDRFLGLTKLRKIGITGPDQAPVEDIMKAWVNGWQKASDKKKNDLAGYQPGKQCIYNIR